MMIVDMVKYRGRINAQKGRRIGLHSLPQANGFYANTCGMTDLGADLDHRGLRYFEMTPEQAQAFIAKGRSK